MQRLFILLLVIAPALAHADEKITVLAVTPDSVIVGAGTSQGVAPGSQFTLFHTVKATHPVTGRAISDAFALGELEAFRVGQGTSQLHGAAELVARAQPGDHVVLTSARRYHVDPWRKEDKEAAPVTEETFEAQDADARGLEDAWKRSLGLDFSARIAVWTAYLDSFPDSVHAAEVRREIGSLAQQLEARKKLDEELALESSPARMRGDALVDLARSSGAIKQDNVVWLPPRRVETGKDLDVAFTILNANGVIGGVLYYRTAGAEGYESVPLAIRVSGGAWARIPGAQVTGTAIELFAELRDASGNLPVLATAEVPHVVTVLPPAVETRPERHGRSRVRAMAELVDFDGGGTAGFDQYWRTEVDFAYRFFEPVHLVRIGMGVLGGTGGPKDVIDETPDCIEDGVFRCRRVSFTYGYLEIEKRLSRSVALVVRPLLGSAYRESTPTEGEGREFFASFGLQTGVRLGAEQGTNLALSMSLTRDFGQAFAAAFTWDVIPLIPIVIGAEVTDQPVPEDYGVRVTGDVGYRGAGRIYPSLRLSYQARDIDHAGVSGGLALQFDW